MAKRLSCVVFLAVGCVASGADGDDDREAQGAHDGRIVTLASVFDGKVVDVSGASVAENAPVIQYAAKGSDNQRWTLRGVRSNVYELVAIHSGKCLEISGSTNGARAHQATCDHRSAQQFRLRWTGEAHTLVGLASGKCLDVTDFRTDDGAPLQQWSCSGNDNQAWRIKDAPSSPPVVSDAGAPPPPKDAGSTPSTPVDAGSSPSLTWRKANLTNYTSYPDPGSEECIKYSGCEWAGQFAALPSKMSEDWVKSHNILSVHSKDFAKYKLKTLRLRQGTKTIDAVVYDECADSDCSGCCTANSKETGFLIDIEKYTMERFGSGDGVVEWACIDC